MIFPYTDKNDLVVRLNALLAPMVSLMQSIQNGTMVTSPRACYWLGGTAYDDVGTKVPLKCGRKRPVIERVITTFPRRILNM